MNIAFVGIADFPAGGATTSRMSLLARALHEAGHNVVIYLLRAQASVNEGCASTGTVARYEDRELRFVYLNGRPDRPRTLLLKLRDTVQGMYNGFKLIARSARANDLDAVIFYTPNVIDIMTMAIACGLFRIPIILEICEIRTTDDEQQSWSVHNAIKHFGNWLVERLAHHFSRGVIVISSKIEGFYMSKGMDPGSIIRIPALADTSMGLINESGESVTQLVGRRFFLNASSFAAKEGLQFLISAFAESGLADEGISLVFTGNPNSATRERLEQQARDRNIANRIIFTGFISKEQLHWCYKNALALLCCRTNSDYANYGFPTKLADYLSAGKPVIVTDVSDIHRYVKDNISAYVARPEDPTHIAEKMRAIVDSPEQALSIAIAGNQVARQSFDYRVYKSQLSEFVVNVCKIGEPKS